MISIEQIKAARALLGWSQADLATKSGYALPTLNNIERGLSMPREATLRDIKITLERAGVQFLGKTGVRLVKEILDIQMLDGPDCIRVLYDDLYDTVREDGGEILLSNIDENKFMDFDPDTLKLHLLRTGDRPDISHKLLFRHGDTNILRPELFEPLGEGEKLPIASESEWRWLPENLFGLASTAIYGDKYAVILWGDHTRVVITHNPSMADTFRKQFMAIWEGAEKIPAHLMPN